MEGGRFFSDIRRRSSVIRTGEADVKVSVLSGSCAGLVPARDLEQAPKGIWWMPRHREAMKDVARCEKPRGGASARRSADLRMGEPGP